MAGMSAADYIPDTRCLTALAAAAKACQGMSHCTETLRDGVRRRLPSASMMLVGEQPGDQEDRAGDHSSGPRAGCWTKRCGAAGIDRDSLYVTNAVKHFKFSRAERGKRRIHQTPSRTEVVACRPGCSPNWVRCIRK